MFFTCPLHIGGVYMHLSITCIRHFDAGTVHRTMCRDSTLLSPLYIGEFQCTSFSIYSLPRTVHTISRCYRPVYYNSISCPKTPSINFNSCFRSTRISVRYNMTDTNQGGDTSKKTYHKKATGNAWTTVKNHSKDDDLKLYGSAFW